MYLCVCVISVKHFMLDLFFACYELYHFSDKARVQVPLGSLDWHVESDQGFQIRPPHLAADRKTVCRNPNGTAMHILVYIICRYVLLTICSILAIVVIVSSPIAKYSYSHCQRSN